MHFELTLAALALLALIQALRTLQSFFDRSRESRSSTRRLPPGRTVMAGWVKDAPQGHREAAASHRDPRPQGVGGCSRP